jgi:hypothetical protein
MTRRLIRYPTGWILAVLVDDGGAASADASVTSRLE